MSIGNLKTEGSKGTNFPWQYKMLKGLQGIIDAITGNATEATLLLIKSNTDSLVDTSNAPTILRATASTLVALNTQVIKSISFYNATTNALNIANVNGVILRQGETVNFDAGGNGNTFPANSFNYDADPAGVGAGDLLIIYVV